MRKITLENLNTLTDDDCVIVYRDDKSLLPEKPLMLMVSYANMSVDGYVMYGFMNTKNPLITLRSFESNSKIKSIENAIELGYDVYAAESITRIYFTNSMNPEVYEQKKPDLSTSNKITDLGKIQGLDDYIFDLIRHHTEFLIFDLSLSEHPKDTVRAATQRFITEKLQ